MREWFLSNQEVRQDLNSGDSFTCRHEAVALGDFSAAGGEADLDGRAGVTGVQSLEAGVTADRGARWQPKWGGK